MHALHVVKTTQMKQSNVVNVASQCQLIVETASRQSLKALSSALNAEQKPHLHAKNAGAM